MGPAVLAWDPSPAAVGGPPPFEEHVLQFGGGADLMAQGQAFTDGACRLAQNQEGGMGGVCYGR